MDAKELEAELSVLPGQIEKARQVRDRWTAELMKRWPEAHLNDSAFITTHLRAEAAGAEVISLTMRWIKAGRLYREMVPGPIV